MFRRFAPRPPVTTFELGPFDRVVLVSDRTMTPAQREHAQRQIEIAVAKPGVVKALVLDGGWQINIIKHKGPDNA